MRLLHSSTLQFKEFYETQIPEYAILSHRWGDDEVTYQDWQCGRKKKSSGYLKILKCCELAASDGLSWAWVDTCCIDKASSAELTEAINSMFRWYRDAQMCYAYLRDVPPIDYSIKGKEYDGFVRSKWFSRGWTLQELIAPKTVNFLDQEWRFIGDKNRLRKEISAATGIAVDDILCDQSRLSRLSVATKMSWASKRHTTRSEDMAYCLMGLFDVNMPLLYGEGHNAFLRLQMEIINASDDESIFAWTAKLVNENLPSRDMCGILAPWPMCFRNSGDIRNGGYLKMEPERAPYAVTNKGLQFDAQIIPVPGTNNREFDIPFDCSNHRKNYPLAITVRQIYDHTWVRTSSSSLRPCEELGDERYRSVQNVNSERRTIFLKVRGIAHIEMA